MILLPVWLFCLEQAFYVSSTPLGRAGSPETSSLSLFSANSTRFNLTASGFGALTARIPFAINDSKTFLYIYNNSRQSLGQTAVRNLLFNAYTSVTNLIEIAGDGVVPLSAEPYEAVTAGAYIRVTTESAHVEAMKWSNLKDALWGLREYMVVQRHFFAIHFEIQRTDDDGPFYLGQGRLDLAAG